MPLVVHVGLALVVPALGPDEGGPVLLDGGLHDVGRHSLPHQVHQRVRGRHVTRIDLLGALKTK